MMMQTWKLKIKWSPYEDHLFPSIAGKLSIKNQIIKHKMDSYYSKQPKWYIMDEEGERDKEVTFEKENM